jgi:GR25 family glycosyltransferase involved in LPS biosynthesis
MLKADDHFTSVGLEDVEFFYGLHGEIAGLRTTHVYGLDADKDYIMGPKPIGIWLGHYMLWSHLARLPDEYVMILEVDAKFPPDWKLHMVDALSSLPDGFDFLFPGHCCLADTPKVHVAGNVWRTEKAQCNHCYIVRVGILPTVLSLIRRVWAPIDIQLMLEVLPKVRSFAIIPRLVDQFDTDIGPP